jgi:predicted O-methyltransferase YrrM
VSDSVHDQVDDYLEELFGDAEDTVLARALQRAEDAGLPPIQVTATIGRLLHVLALACGARSILEVGTLGGFSTIWLARALPEGGRLVSLELDPSHAEVARENLRDAGVDTGVEVRVGRALDLLDELRRAEEGPFDLVFIDADKEPYAEYLEAAIALGRAGTLIVADNVVRGGAVLEPGDDERAAGVARFNDAVAADARVTAAVVQVVGAKGHDGIALAVVNARGGDVT